MKKSTSLLALTAIASSLVTTAPVFADEVPTSDSKETPVKAVLELPDNGGENPTIPEDPDENNNNNNNPDAAFAIAYQPKIFDFGTTKLQESGEQTISVKDAGENPYRVGVKDKRRQNAGWTLSAQLTWTSDNKNQMAGTKIHVGSAEVKKNVDGSVSGDVNPDNVTGKDSFDITDTADNIITASAQQRNDVYDDKLDNITLVIPEAKNVAAGTYEGTVTWSLQSTPE